MEFRIIESCKKNCLKKIAKSAKNIDKICVCVRRKISNLNSKQTNTEFKRMTIEKKKPNQIRFGFRIYASTHTHTGTHWIKNHQPDRHIWISRNFQRNFSGNWNAWQWNYCETVKIWQKKTKKITPTFFNGSRHHRHRILFKRIQIHQKWLNQVFSLSIIDDCRSLCSELFVEFVFR